MSKTLKEIEISLTENPTTDASRQCIRELMAYYKLSGSPGGWSAIGKVLYKLLKQQNNRGKDE